MSDGHRHSSNKSKRLTCQWTGIAVRACTFLDTGRPLHHQMPAILHPEDYDLWLDPGIQESERF